MDGVSLLLQKARQAGLRVSTDGDTLVVQGPRRLEPLARRLVAEKLQVVRALVQEQAIAWRIVVMRSQVPTIGAIPLLLARPGAPSDTDHCCSCGDPLPPEARYRCAACVAAAVAVLGDAP